jgi:hypothetical protein
VTESAALGPNTEPGCRLGFRISWPLAAGVTLQPGSTAEVTPGSWSGCSHGRTVLAWSRPALPARPGRGGHSDYGARPGHTVAASRVNLAILAVGRTRNHSLSGRLPFHGDSDSARMTEPRSHPGAPRPGRRATDSKVEQSQAPSMVTLGALSSLLAQRRLAVTGSLSRCHRHGLPGGTVRDGRR